MTIKTIIEPFRIKMVEPITMHTEEERESFAITSARARASALSC